MTIDHDMFELEECPNCRGGGMIMTEGDWCVYVECCDCGAHTVYAEYNNEEEKQDAARRVVTLWNLGKVIRLEPGE